MITEGMRARDDGIARALANPTLPPWKVVARDAIVALAHRGERFTAEDVRNLAGDPPTAAAMGAVLHSAARLGLIHRAGFTKAARASSHATIIAVWEAGDAVLELGDHFAGRSAAVPPAPEPDEVWVCLACGAKFSKPPGSPILGGYRAGRCGTCRKTVTFRRER